MANKKVRSIDQDFFQVGSIWYFRSSWDLAKEFRINGYYQIVGKQSRGMRFMKQIYPHVTQHESDKDVECRELIDYKYLGNYRPVFKPGEGGAFRALYGL